MEFFACCPQVAEQNGGYLFSPHAFGIWLPRGPGKEFVFFLLLLQVLFFVFF